MFRCHRGIQLGTHRRLFECRPTAVFLRAAGPLGAGVVQQSLADILPERVRTIETSGICLLDLDDPGTAAAAHPQNMLRNLAQPQRPSGSACRLGIGVGVSEKGLPVFLRQIIVWSQSSLPRHVFADESCHLFHLLGGRHAPARGSIGHVKLEHNMNKRVESRTEKLAPIARQPMSEPWSAVRLESRPPRTGVLRTWPPVPTGKASCVCRS